MPEEYVDAIPADRVVQYHLAGHTNKGTHILDTHSGRAVDEVWELYARASARTGPVSTLYEWDEEIPAAGRGDAEARRPRLSAALGGRPGDRMAPELALGGLQRWLQAVVVHPGEIAEALASREAVALVPRERVDRW